MDHSQDLVALYAARKTQTIVSKPTVEQESLLGMYGAPVLWNLSAADEGTEICDDWTLIHAKYNPHDYG